METTDADLKNMSRLQEIVFIDQDEISLFLDKQALTEFESYYSLNYFINTRKALVFLKSLKTSYILLVSARIIIDDSDFISLINEVSVPSKICLLSSSPELDKNHIADFEFYTFIQKPLTIKDFLKFLPFEDRHSMVTKGKEKV